MADSAILFVHGILGRPEQFEPLIPLVPKDWDIKNLILKGHGGTPKDFGRYPMKEWKSEVHSTLKNLCDNHRHVYVVGHSLGTLFAIQESMKLPIEGLFLLNVPLGVRVTGKLFKLCFQVFFDCIDKKDPFVMAAKKSYGISNDRNLLHYAKWVPRYIELFQEIKYTRNTVDKLTTPTIAFISLKDEMASPVSARILKEKSKARVIIMRESGHFYYAPKDLEKMKRVFVADFIKA